MKRKKTSFEELKKMLDIIHKDSQIMKIAKKFVANLGSRA